MKYGFYFLLFSFYLFQIPFLFSEENIQIKNISTFLSEDTESIQIEFVSSFQKTISLISIEKGWAQFSIPNTEFPQNLSYQKINDRFLKEIKLFQEKENSLMEVHFSNELFDLKNKLDIEYKNESVFFIIQRDETKNSFFSTNSNTDTPQQNVFESSIYGEGSSFSSWVWKVVLTLLFILTLLSLILWIYNRFFAKRFHYGKGKYQIHVASTHHLNPKQKIVVLKINHHAYVCGISQNQISLIGDLSEDQEQTFKKLIEQSGMNLGALKTEYLKDIQRNKVQGEDVQGSKRQGEEEVLTTEKTSFQKELIKKVKQMRQID